MPEPVHTQKLPAQPHGTKLFAAVASTCPSAHPTASQPSPPEGLGTLAISPHTFHQPMRCRYSDPMETALASWGEFNVAIAGAGAALGGLLIVALSVNIKQIAESRGLAARAGAAISALILGVVLACAALIPDQPLWAFGVEVLIGVLMGGVIAVLAARAILQDDSPGRPRKWDKQHIASFVFPLAIYLVGGVLLVLSVPAGLLVVALATIVALIGAVVFSWVALVEILR